VDPLVLTATLDDDTRRHFDRLRRTHFPPERNHLDAHVTLFHALPGARRSGIERALAAAVVRRPVPVRVIGLRLLGRGVAYVLASDGLAAIRAALAREWAPWLSTQDRAKRDDLHVTVQNKVPAERARALHADLSAAFEPWAAVATGLALWRYVGGPWEPLARFPFRG
jgi:hypothetical protein